MSLRGDTERSAAPVLAVCGFAREARIAAGPGVEAVQAGGDPDRLRSLLVGRAGPLPRAVVSFGIAGGLDPDLRPGAIVVASAIVADTRFAAASSLADRLAERLSGLDAAVIRASLAGVEEAVTTPAGKAALRARTGAAAVDMESHVAAAYAERHGLPFCTLRVVCDPAERTLPRFAATALKPNGEPNVPAILAALLRREAGIGELIGLARDSGAAFAGLSRARALLGLALGIDA